MKNKIFLTSVFALAFACPAMAVDGNATIENGDTCNVDNLGTSTNNDTANLEAIWTLDPRTCLAGQYYDATTNTCLTCEAGSFCGGGTFNVESNPNGGGTTLCSTLSGGYNSSAAGAKANTDCYKACVASDVDHALAVSGNVYYNGSTGNKQCSPTSCEAGWHVQEGLDMSQITVSDLMPTNIASKDNGDFYEQTTTDMLNSLGFSDTSNVEIVEQGESFYGIDNNNKWAVKYDDFGTIRGAAICSTSEGTNNNYSWSNPTTFASLADETGQSGANYCYIRIQGYRPDGSSSWQNVNSDFVFASVFDNPQDCASECLNAYTYLIYTKNVYSGLLSNLLSSVPVTAATCEANNIGLAWYNDTVANNGTTITPTNSEANQCSYSGTITVPTNTMQKAGYTFGGWKLRTNTTPVTPNGGNIN